MDRSIVVTGGSLGIGRATVEAFLAEGDRVVFTARGEAEAKKFLGERSEDVQKGRLFFLRSDASVANDAEKLAAFTKEKLGGCDVLINNAAVFIGGLLHQNSEEDFEKLFGINVRGPFLTSKAFLPMMLERKKGHIIMIASLAGMGGGYGMTLYCMTKAAVINMARAMALDYMQYGIRVNAVSPSATETAMFLGGNSKETIDAFRGQNPAHVLGKPEDIANALVSIADEKNIYINGQNIAVDGGLSAWNGEYNQSREPGQAYRE